MTTKARVDQLVAIHEHYEPTVSDLEDDLEDDGLNLHVNSAPDDALPADWDAANERALAGFIESKRPDAEAGDLLALLAAARARLIDAAVHPACDRVAIEPWLFAALEQIVRQATFGAFKRPSGPNAPQARKHRSLVDMLRCFKVQHLRSRGVKWDQVYELASEELSWTDHGGAPATIKASYLRAMKTDLATRVPADGLVTLPESVIESWDALG